MEYCLYKISVLWRVNMVNIGLEGKRNYKTKRTMRIYQILETLKKLRIFSVFWKPFEKISGSLENIKIQLTYTHIEDIKKPKHNFSKGELEMLHPNLKLRIHRTRETQDL